MFSPNSGELVKNSVYVPRAAYVTAHPGETGVPLVEIAGPLGASVEEANRISDPETFVSWKPASDLVLVHETTNQQKNRRKLV